MWMGVCVRMQACLCGGGGGVRVHVSVHLNLCC